MNDEKPNGAASRFEPDVGDRIKGGLDYVRDYAEDAAETVEEKFNKVERRIRHEGPQGRSRTLLKVGLILIVGLMVLGGIVSMVSGS